MSTIKKVSTPKEQYFSACSKVTIVGILRLISVLFPWILTTKKGRA
jgi:hypothetical protein